MVLKIVRHCFFARLCVNNFVDRRNIEFLPNRYHTFVPAYQFLFQLKLKLFYGLLYS